MTPLAPLLTLLALASPFQAEEPNVREGNERLLSGDGAAAARHYDDAERQVGPKPQIDFDRGNALAKQGRLAEARQAWTQALEHGADPALASRALQNTGNTLAAEGDREGAARAYADALVRDPGNEDARYNLEVLDRQKKSEGKGAPKDQGEEGRKQQQGPSQQGPGQAQRKPPEEKPGPGPEGKPPEPRPPEPKPAEQGTTAEREQREAEQREAERREAERQGKPGAQDGGTARAGGLDKQDAERLLDALRARERNMPMGQVGRKDARRRDVEKDW